MKTIYTWEYLEELILKYFKTNECFIEAFEEEKRFEITYATFRQQKRRQSKKYLNDYIEFIFEQYEKPHIRLASVFTQILDELLKNNFSSKSVKLINTGSNFKIVKSWEANNHELFDIKNEAHIIVKEIIKSSVFREIFGEIKFINKMIQGRLTKYIDKKIALVEYVNLSYNSAEIMLEFKINKMTVAIPIPVESFEQIILELK